MFLFALNLGFISYGFLYLKLFFFKEGQFVEEHQALIY